MTSSRFYGVGLPYRKIPDMPGKLFVVEGPDGVGRSTQIGLLSAWLESEGHGVSNTGFRRSQLTQKGLEQGRSGHTLNKTTMSLFYATDFADRLENQIIPALRAGFYVLSDRYMYSIFARDIVRGADPEWLRRVYGFALVPDLVLYLRIGVDDLVPRVISGGGFDFWESGMDMGIADNLYDSFRTYQSRISHELDRMAKEYDFVTIDASRSVTEIFEDLKKEISAVV
ncbi:MAG: thymidylate kinase [Armatimonadetes bacterium]|nr:thymidylate kinase [Armatimonadota bacterium]